MSTSPQIKKIPEEAPESESEDSGADTYIVVTYNDGTICKIKIGAGQNVVRTQGVPQVVQFPFQQTIPVQIPIATSNGQTIIQTVHIPIQTLASAIPNGGINLGNIGNLGLGNQIQILGGQPQLTQLPQQVVVTPSGQIQFVQQAPQNWTQNANGTITIQTSIANDSSQQQQQQTNNSVSSTTQASNVVTSTTQTTQANAQATAQNQQQQQVQQQQQNQQQQQPQQITLQGSNQQFTVLPSLSQIQQIQQIGQIPIQNIPGLGNVQLIPAGNFQLGNGQNITLQQGSPNNQQILQAIQAPNILSNANLLSNLGLGTQQMQQIQQDPLDPTKWQVINQPIMVTTGQLANGSVTAIKSESETKPKTRLRRVACTCPNCTDIDARNNGEKKKQHLCHIQGCGKVYGKTSHLRAHLRWHAGERPFVCQWLFCGKRFTRSDELQRHRRTHTGEKRFQCTECLKKFMRSDHLSKHIKTHTKGRTASNSEAGTSSTKIELVDVGKIKAEIEADEEEGIEDGMEELGEEEEGEDGTLDEEEGDGEEQDDQETQEMMITINTTEDGSELILSDK